MEKEKNAQEIIFHLNIKTNRKIEKTTHARRTGQRGPVS